MALRIGHEPFGLRAVFDADARLLLGSALNIPGRQLDGIHFAMEFLPDATRRFYGKQPVHDITAEGPRRA